MVKNSWNSENDKDRDDNDNRRPSTVYTYDKKPTALIECRIKLESIFTLVMSVVIACFMRWLKIRCKENRYL